MDADQAPPRGTGMDACVQGRPGPLPARGFQREIATENTVSEETLASHTYRRSIQEAHAIKIHMHFIHHMLTAFAETSGVCMCYGLRSCCNDNFFQIRPFDPLNTGNGKSK
jgi:hypothetical protein